MIRRSVPFPVQFNQSPFTFYNCNFYTARLIISIHDMSLLRLNRVIDFLASGRSRRRLRPLHEFESCYKFSTQNNDTISTVELAYSFYEPTEKRADESSKKAPIVLLHGILRSRRDWNPLAKSLSQRTNRKVISPDLRNHGESGYSPELSYAQMGRDVDRLLTDLRIDKAILIGHSAGGRVAMYLALTRPELVEGLISVDIVPNRTSSQLKSLAKLGRALKSFRFEEHVPLSEARMSADRRLSDFVTWEEMRQYLVKNVVESTSQPGRYQWCPKLLVLIDTCEAISSFPDFGDRSAFAGATLFVGGTKSDSIIPEDHEKVKELFPAALFRYIDAGHQLHKEKSQELLDIVVPFVTMI